MALYRLVACSFKNTNDQLRALTINKPIKYPYLLTLSVKLFLFTNQVL